MNLDDHLAQFSLRLIRDAMNEATALYWLRRAEQFEWARPRPGDYPGRSTLRDINAADQRCRLAAEACRRQAALAKEMVA